MNADLPTSSAAVDREPFRRLRMPIDNPWGRGTMQVLDFGPPDRPVDLIFSHANGFNARTYTTLLKPLAETHRLWVPDLRGHGGTDLPTPQGRRNWDDMVADLLALLSQVGAQPVTLAGHSMGATTSLLAAAQAPDRVEALVLLEPVIWRPLFSVAMNLPGAGRGARNAPIAKNAMKRRRTFASRDEAFLAYQGRGAFKGWPDTILRDYLADGLVTQGEAWTLACSPEWEAANYGAQANRSWLALMGLDKPVHILKGDTHSTCHVPDRPFGRAHIRSETLVGANHFLPMLKPMEARAAIQSALD